MRELIRHILREHNREISDQRNPRGYWTDEKMKEITSQYDNYTKFNKEQPDLVMALRRKGLLNDFTSHMLRTQREPYTNDELELEARKYRSVSDFKKGSPLHYKSSVNKGLMSQFRNFLTSKVRDWSDDDLSNEVEKYETLQDFKNSSPSAYTLILRRGLSHLLDNLQRKGTGVEKYWTHEKIIETAKKFTKLKDFADAFPAAYSRALKDGWIEEIKSFLEHGKRGYWTIDKVLEIAKNYETIKDFRIANKKAYDISVHNGWLDELKKVLKSARGEDWTYEKVKEIASKYTSLSDFIEKDKAAYYAALNKGWHDELTKDMVRVGNLVKRAVYAFEFPDNSVYIGLTLNLGLREKQHLSNEGYTAVSNHIKKTNLKPTFKKISNDYLDANDASNLEKCTIDKYKDEGWKILNRMKGGGLGFACSRVYTYEKVKNAASNYGTIGEFKEKDNPNYRASIRNGWFDEVTKHMTRKVRKKISKDEVATIVQNYTTLADFEREQPSYYAAAKRNKWLDLLSKLKRKQRKRGSTIFN